MSGEPRAWVVSGRKGMHPHIHYLHDADIVGAVQLALLDHFLLERGKVPLQVFPLAGVLLLQV